MQWGLPCGRQPLENSPVLLCGQDQQEELPPGLQIMPMLTAKPNLLRHHGKSYTLEATRFQATPLMVTALAVGEIDVGLLNSTALALGVVFAVGALALLYGASCRRLRGAALRCASRRGCVGSGDPPRYGALGGGEVDSGRTSRSRTPVPVELFACSRTSVPVELFVPGLHGPVAKKRLHSSLCCWDLSCSVHRRSLRGSALM